MTPEHINPLQWNNAVGVARQSCARIFRDGGVPADAVRAFEVHLDAEGRVDWSKAVDAIARVLCAAPSRRAA
jgi:hypothetical protein